MAQPHPLDQLRAEEILHAREAVLHAWPKALIQFRSIFLEEPTKSSLLPFLEAEHAGSLSKDTPRPPRLARVQYDVIQDGKFCGYTESVMDIDSKKEVKREAFDTSCQPYLTMEEMKQFFDHCLPSPLFQEAISQFKLPEGYEVELEPWPYGYSDPGEAPPRYIQGLCFAKDKRNGNMDSNHYSHPIPMFAVCDVYKREIVKIEKLATGGTADGLAYDTHQANAVDHCRPAEYVPELADVEYRTDIKPLNIIQPEGPSFKVSNESLVEWQKWRFRVGFNPREGVTLHDVHYDGRSVFFRLALSEMTVPYGDPRPPFHRKQAFDFGDGGAGRSANNLSLGCDCLGAIKYLSTFNTDFSGQPISAPNVVCIHEQDNGIGWKHTNFRTDRPVVTRYRELIIQYIITLGNYEYVFAYKFDQAGAISLEVRPTGVISVVNIDPGKTSPWGNVVSPGVLGQNHQHLFCLRVDPAIDGHKNTIFREESLPMAMDPATNPYGNAYKVVTEPVEVCSAFNASPFTNLVVKLSNTNVRNPISGKPVSYKFTPPATQLLLADPQSIMARRAKFTRHHVWVTSYRDGELYAAGDFTNQSNEERGGLADAAARNDSTVDSDVVLWSVFGFTHNPRVEDWPVMPVEKIELQFRPSDFFDRNPALDVPAVKNTTSVLVGDNSCCQSN
ncbi:copper amine oxidase 1 [Uncinocarpus reesii 1704]|uniref:Amine oxidase n=1 Tax=Uncinocarpus reesii (strain UAMH 1704) TaxID=336963 RepID=C4JLA8_UNCRE|nr:copper amine oxidase 1 [Uncinocarpus reesii 1704]EEP78770.1 copper amine oxidase 1 [Uncinocarpus reesii 1704]